MLSGVKYLHDHDIVHRDPKRVVLPFFHPQVLYGIFGPDNWRTDRPENILFRTKDPSSSSTLGYTLLSEDTSHMHVTRPSSANHLDSDRAPYVPRK